MSVKKYEEEYERLNVKFDIYTGESKVGKASMDKAFTQLKEMGLISELEGAKRVDCEKWKPDKLVVRKKVRQVFLNDLLPVLFIYVNIFW